MNNVRKQLWYCLLCLSLLVLPLQAHGGMACDHGAIMPDSHCASMQGSADNNGAGAKTDYDQQNTTTCCDSVDCKCSISITSIAPAVGLLSINSPLLAVTGQLMSLVSFFAYSESPPPIAT